MEIGKKAPGFTLFTTDKTPVSPEDYLGSNILLLFFPLAFTSVCTKELCSVRDNIAFYNSVSAKIIGISVDSLYTLKKYKEEQQLNFQLASDFNKEVSTLYECMYPVFGFGMKGVSKRAAFIIDREGILQYAEILENASDIPDFKAIMDKLEKLS
jgi:peroxiredoxin